MKIDLSNEKLFDINEIELDKPVNFIFGKNGTGKSTITKLVKEQITDKDIRIYQGLKSVIANGRLNSVTLGEENVSAQRNIEKFESEIANFVEEKRGYEEIKQSLTLEKNSLNKELKAQENKINNFFSSSAREIKNNDLHIASTSYNQPTFKAEIKYAFRLSVDERNKCKEYLKIDEKNASLIKLPEINFLQIFEDTRDIFVKKVEEEIVVKRLDSDPKISFAQKGLELHERGDVCSFCGSNIPDETFAELETFFSASKIKEFEVAINDQIDRISEAQVLVEKVVIANEDFYSQFANEVGEIKKKWDNIKKEQVKFLLSLKEKMIEKSTKLFSTLTFEELKLPDSGKDIIERYNKIVEKNNAEDISRLKKFSKDLLRFDLIDAYVEKFDLATEKNKLKAIQDKLDESVRSSEANDCEILKIKQTISSIREKISKEVEKTKSEKKLATNINKKLELYVDFQLEHIEPDAGMHQGYYRIKSKSENIDVYRDIGTLSEGEKNIIGFLYFIEKLDEQIDNPLDKVIIFDDPMDSNDDMMQYIIITEIQELMKPIDKNKTNDKLVL